MTDGMLTFKGKLQRFDANYVWLEVPSSEKTATVKFARKSIPNIKGYVAGIAELTVSVPANEYFQLNPQYK